MSSQNEIAAPQKQFAHESIAASEQAATPITMTPEQLPWLDVPIELSTALVTLKDESCPPFRFASAIGTDAKLVESAQGMTDGQRQNTDNMFWSRIGPFLVDGYSAAVDTMPEASVGNTVNVMRNKGGQRVYFTRHEGADGVVEVTRLAVCDKNKQGQVMKRLSAATDAKMQRKLSK